MWDRGGMLREVRKHEGFPHGKVSLSFSPFLGDSGGGGERAGGDIHTRSESTGAVCMQ